MASLNNAEILAMRDRIRDLEARLTARSVLTVKIKRVEDGGKGTVCVYGLQRRPVALYSGQWGRLAAFMPKVLDFIASKPEGMSVREAE